MLSSKPLTAFRNFHIKGLLITAVIVSSVANTASAEDCSEVLLDGVFNTTTFNSNDSEETQIDNYLGSLTYEQYKKDVSDGLSFSYLDVGLGNNFSSQEFSSWQQQFKQHTISGVSHAAAQNFIQKTASEAILSAYEACIASVQPVWSTVTVDPSGPEKITFTAGYHPVTQTPLPRVKSFTVTGGKVASPNPFSVGAQVPFAGTTAVITRTRVNSPVAEYPAVTITLNTDIAPAIQNVHAFPLTPDSPPLNVQVFHSQSDSSVPHPEASVTVPQGFKVIGGGARVNWTGDGSLLTASYPSDARTWAGKAKDHDLPSPATIEVWAFGLSDPNDQWDVRIISQDSDPQSHPEVQLEVPPGYTMTGGGGYVHWLSDGQLLTADYPTSNSSWNVRSKDHMHPDPAVLSGYIIGIKPKNGAPGPEAYVVQKASSVAAHPSAQAELPLGYTMTSGGGFDQWSGQGNLLTGVFPSGQSSFSASGKDHEEPDPASIVAYAVGLKMATAPSSSPMLDEAIFMSGLNFKSNTFSTRSARDQPIRVNGKLSSVFVKELLRHRRAPSVSH